MNQLISILTLTLFLLWCSDKTGKAIPKESADTLRAVSAVKKQSDIFIKNRSLYDPSFISGLSRYPEPIRLADNYLVAGKDTSWFPEVLPLNQAIVFTATKAGNQYRLTVTRTNLTDLTYHFILSGKDNTTLDTKTGKSVLGSMFFFGSEMDKDTQTGEGYASYEYWDKKADCWLAVRIGTCREKNGKLRAMIEYGCEDKNQPHLRLKECPTLRTE